MKRVSMQGRTRSETAVERRDRVAPILELDPRNPDVVRARARRAELSRRCPKKIGPTEAASPGGGW